MEERFSEKNFMMLIGKLVSFEKDLDAKNELHSFVTRKKVALIDSWNLYREQIRMAEEFIEEYES